MGVKKKLTDISVPSLGKPHVIEHCKKQIKVTYVCI
jgi:hypothetical protein